MASNTSVVAEERYGIQYISSGRGKVWHPIHLWWESKNMAANTSVVKYERYRIYQYCLKNIMTSNIIIIGSNTSIVLDKLHNTQYTNSVR